MNITDGKMQDDKTSFSIPGAHGGGGGGTATHYKSLEDWRETCFKITRHHAETNAIALELAEALHSLRRAVIAHYGWENNETEIGLARDEATTVLAKWEKTK
jgi:hypothetical protein